MRIMLLPVAKLVPPELGITSLAGLEASVPMVMVVVPAKVTSASRVTVTFALMVMVQLLQFAEGTAPGAQVIELLHMPELVAVYCARPGFTKANIVSTRVRAA